jgi:hypothetical protein
VTLEQMLGQIGGRLMVALAANISRRVVAASAAGRSQQEIDDLVNA